MEFTNTFNFNSQEYPCQGGDTVKMDENSILVQIKGDTAQLNAALEKANTDLKAFGKTANDVSKYVNSWTVSASKYSMILHGIKNAWGLLSGIMRALLSSFVEFGTVLDTVSKQTNISATNLSRLKYAAEQSGVQFEVMADALKTFQEQLGAARFDDAGAIGKLSAVGIDPQSFDGLSEQDQFLKLADHISRITDPAKQARTAIELFGDAGYQLLPFFQQGKDGIEALCKEADRLGFTFTEKDAKSAAELQKNIDALKSSIVFVGQQIMEILAEPLTLLLKLFKAMIKTIGEVIERYQTFIKYGGLLALAVGGITAACIKLAAVWPVLKTAILAINPVWAGLAVVIAGVTLAVDAYIQSIGKAEQATSDLLDQQLKPHQERIRKFENRMNTAREGVQQGLDSAQAWRSEDEAKKKEEEEAALPEHVKELQALDKELELRQKVLEEAEKELDVLLENSAISQKEAKRREEEIAREREYLNIWYRENLAKIEAKKLAEETAEIERRKAEDARKAAEAAQKEAEAKKKAADEAKKAADEAKKAQKEAEEARKKEAETAKRLEDAKDEAEEIRSPEAVELATEEANLLLAQEELAFLDPDADPEKLAKLQKEIADREKRVKKAAEKEQESSLARAQEKMETAYYHYREGEDFARKNPGKTTEEKARQEEALNQRWKNFVQAKQAYEDRLGSVPSSPMFQAAELSSRGTFSAFGLDSVLGADVQKEQLDNLKKICSAVLGLYEKAQGETVLKPAH